MPSKPVTPQEMFDLWQKMVNPGAYPLQSLMFPVLDAKELDKKVAELAAVEHWLKANLGMLQLTIKSLEYQRAMLKGGEKFQATLREGAKGAAGEEHVPEADAPSPALWAWDMMARAGKDTMTQPKPASPKAKSKRARR